MKNQINNQLNELSCDVIGDILPLYHDGVCSEASRALVEEHVKNCGKCEKLLKMLNDESAFNALSVENREIIKRHTKKEMTVAVKTGIIIASLLLLPVIIAIMLTLPGYSDWKTNAVLIASMLLVAGLTVVPLISKQKKFSKTVIFSTVALLLVIFFTEMFFDDGGLLRFFEIAFSTVFGLSVVLFPFVIRQAELPDTLKNHKRLLTMIWDTIWFYLMIFIFVIAYSDARKDLILVSTFFVAGIWLLFLTIQYLKTNGFVRAGIATFITGIWISIGNYLGWVMIYDYDVHVPIFVVSIILGAVLLMIGLFHGRKRKIEL